MSSSLGAVGECVPHAFIRQRSRKGVGVDRWLRRAANNLALGAGVHPEELHLTRAEVDLLLDLAGSAARESGTRANAPLYCYLLGRAAALGGHPLAELGEREHAALGGMRPKR
jgi:Domain of unknown function (DUF6457)